MANNSDIRAARAASRPTRGGELPSMDFRGITAQLHALRGKYKDGGSVWGGHGKKSAPVFPK